MTATEPDLLYRASGRMRTLRSVPGITTYGVWEPFEWNHDGVRRLGARLVPDEPPWRSLFAALDEAGQALSGAPVTMLEQADAVVACCWRYGSYFHVLTAGEFYPPFGKDRGLSRLDNSEMKRINLEFSSAVAAWLADRDADPERLNRRVRAAARLLSMPWQRGRPGRLNETLISEGRGIIRMLLSCFDEFGGNSAPGERLTVRQEANYLVAHCYRNGQIENSHADDWSHGREIPGFVRFRSKEIDRLCRNTAEMLGRAFVVWSDERLAGLLPFAFRAEPSAESWSVTHETAPVEYPGMPYSGNLAARLGWLAERVSPMYAPAPEDVCC